MLATPQSIQPIATHREWTLPRCLFNSPLLALALTLLVPTIVFYF